MLNPHSASASIKATVLVEKIKHWVDLDDSVCRGQLGVDTCAREFCWGNRAILFAQLQIL